MQADEEGFLYPQVNMDVCVDCGLCEKVCPELNVCTNNEPVKAFAAKNGDKVVKLSSSSGGVFTLLAKNVIEAGGVVYGVKWNDNWHTAFSLAEHIDELKAFRGAKYVKAKNEGVFCDVEKKLKEGREVLFSGLPCDVNALKLFLRKDYPNLLTVACVCHGVPSASLWNKYLDEECRKRKENRKDIIAVNLRDKRSGWRNYSCTISFAGGKTECQYHDDNPWMRAFIHNLSLRPSCYQCRSKYQNSMADITLGDFWGGQSLLGNSDDVLQDSGISLVLIQSEKGGKSCVNSGVTFIKEFDVPEVAHYNAAIIKSAPENPKRTEFFTRIENGESFIFVSKRLAKSPWTLRVKIAVAKLINSLHK
jgi:coenzyme F420-reducing hydrogenase beta subunit